MATPKPTFGGNGVDLSEVRALIAKLDRIGRQLGVAVADVRPEMGGYMEYSAALEFGATFTSVARPYSLRPRPHIIPAVLDNAAWIVDRIGDGFMEILQDKAQRGLGRDEIVRRAQRIWLRTLKDRPVRQARKNAPFEFGFHRRSIDAFAERRDPSAIRRQQEIAERERAKRARASRRKGSRRSSRRGQ